MTTRGEQRSSDPVRLNGVDVRIPHAVAGIAACAALIAGCAQHHENSRSPVSAHTTVTSALGQLTVRVGLSGGPPVSSRGLALSDSPAAQIVVLLRGENGYSTSQATDTTGQTTFKAPPGSYTVSIGCGRQVAVTIKANQRTTASLGCDVP